MTAAVGAAPCPGSSPALHCPRMPWLLRPGPRRSNGCRRYSSRQHHRPNNTFHAPFCRTSTTLAGPLKLAAVMKGNVSLWRLLIIYCGSRASTVGSCVIMPTWVTAHLVSLRLTLPFAAVLATTFPRLVEKAYGTQVSSRFNTRAVLPSGTRAFR